MTHAETIATLRAARELISTPEKWTRGTAARDATGKPVTRRNEDATCYCTLGALALVTEQWQTAYEALREFTVSPVSIWNDRPERTHGEVVSVFDRAIAKLEAAHAG